MSDIQIIAVGIFLFQSVVGAILVVLDNISESNRSWQPSLFLLFFVGFLFGGFGEFIAHLFAENPDKKESQEQKPKKLTEDVNFLTTKNESQEEQEQEEEEKEEEEEENEKLQEKDNNASRERNFRLGYKYYKKHYSEFKKGYSVLSKIKRRRYRAMRIGFSVFLTWSLAAVIVVLLNFASFK